jgi:hypothetical protein
VQCGLFVRVLVVVASEGQKFGNMLLTHKHCDEVGCIGGFLPLLADHQLTLQRLSAGCKQLLSSESVCPTHFEGQVLFAVMQLCCFGGFLPLHTDSCQSFAVAEHSVYNALHS